MKRIYIILLSLVFVSSNCFSQGFTPPNEENSVVYFARVSNMGYAVSFDLFHNDKYKGKVKSVSYVRYECAPGEHLFWISAENKAFFTADLKKGETYVVIIDAHMGAMTTRVGVNPITSDSKHFKRAKKLILRAKPSVTSKKFIDGKMKKLEARGWINEKLDYYENKRKGTDKVKHISAEMFIPKDFLK
jgi:hypothetical protein